MKSQTIEDLKKSSWKNISKHIQGLEKKGLVLNEVSNNWRLQSFTFKTHLKLWKEKNLGPKHDSIKLKTSKQF